MGKIGVQKVMLAFIGDNPPPPSGTWNSSDPNAPVTQDPNDETVAVVELLSGSVNSVITFDNGVDSATAVLFYDAGSGQFSLTPQAMPAASSARSRPAAFARRG